MKNIRFDLPSWCPNWILERKEPDSSDFGTAAMRGLLFPVLVFLHYIKKIGVGKVAWIGIAAFVILNYLSPPQFRTLVTPLFMVVAAISAGLWTWNDKSQKDGAKRLVFAIVAGIASAFVANQINLLWFATVIFALSRSTLRGVSGNLEGRRLAELEKQRKGLLSKDVVVRPWAICWCIVKNVNDDETTWAKIRPCVLLPPVPWVNGRVAFDPKDYYKYPENGEYYVLICTSQTKRKDDDRYVEIHLNVSSRDIDPFTRTFVQLNELYSMDAKTMNPTVLQMQTEMLSNGQLPQYMVVYQKPIALLSENDILAIVENMPKIDFEAERQRRLRLW
jgi:hypothetical protein